MPDHRPMHPGELPGGQYGGTGPASGLGHGESPDGRPAAGRGDETGLAALVGTAGPGSDRLPVLRRVLARFAQSLEHRLGELLGQGTDVSLARTRTCPLGVWGSEPAAPAVLTSFEVAEWGRAGLLRVDAGLLAGLLGVVLGESPGARPAPRGATRCTAIEARLIERLLSPMLADLGRAFAPVAAATFRFRRVEANFRHAAIGAADSGCLVATFALGSDGAAPSLDLVLPETALDSIRDRLARQDAGEELGPDAAWGSHWARTVWSTEIALDAVLDQRTVPLSAVARLEPGAALELGVAADAPVELRCGELALGSGRAGRRSDRLVVTIEKFLIGCGGPG